MPASPCLRFTEEDFERARRHLMRRDPKLGVLIKKVGRCRLPDSRALPGFEAYRYVVLHVPGLWWQVPFFYTPVHSRLFGHPIYNWIAANRSRL